MKMRERASILCLKDDRLLTVLLEDPYLKLTRLYLPGGKIERSLGEGPAEAAVRETLEETGYSVELCSEKAEILDYDFFWNGVHVPCRTHFFRARLRSEKAQETQWGLQPIERGVKWMPLIRLHQEFNYHPRILSVMESLLLEP